MEPLKWGTLEKKSYMWECDCSLLVLCVNCKFRTSYHQQFWANNLGNWFTYVSCSHMVELDIFWLVFLCLYHHGHWIWDISCLNFPPFFLLKSYWSVFLCWSYNITFCRCSSLNFPAQVSRESLLFVIPAFGGIVSWEGDEAPFKESDETITHQVFQCDLYMYVIS